MPTKKKINALDAAIMRGESLPSKNKKYPGDSDVGMKGFKKKPVIRVKNTPSRTKATPVPLPGKPKSMKPARKPIKKK